MTCSKLLRWFEGYESTVKDSSTTCIEAHGLFSWNAAALLVIFINLRPVSIHAF